MNGLRGRQLCPIHKRRTCCGRDEENERAPRKQPKYWYRGPGVKEFPDGHIERSPSALKRVKDQLLATGTRCAACGNEFADYRDAELAHRKSKGMNGWKRDDSLPNLTLLHVTANRDQGSMDLDIYLATKWKLGVCMQS
jgi:hypothetical protein